MELDALEQAERPRDERTILRRHHVLFSRK
jgi:hypothetical protein